MRVRAPDSVLYRNQGTLLFSDARARRVAALCASALALAHALARSDATSAFCSERAHLDGMVFHKNIVLAQIPRPAYEYAFYKIRLC